MYNISFHLKLYRIIYWTKKYSPKLRFHNKVVYKCKSLSNWWLWACKSTFYLIKKGRICGPCETKHDKPNRLAVHCRYGSYPLLLLTRWNIINNLILAIIQGLCHRKLEFMFPLWLLLHWVQQSVTLNYRTKVTTPASWRMLCTYILTIRTYNSHITLIIAWLLNWGEEDRKIVTSKTHFKLKMKQTDQINLIWNTWSLRWKKWYSNHSH